GGEAYRQYRVDRGRLAVEGFQNSRVLQSLRRREVSSSAPSSRNKGRGSESTRSREQRTQDLSGARPLPHRPVVRSSSGRVRVQVCRRRSPPTPRTKGG